jgi:8-oxo-dGTP diphosphatase
VSLTLDIFIHMDAVGRQGWTGDPDERPLTELGKLQSARIAEELTASPVNGIFSSPALRCRASLEALSKKTGLPVQVMPGFRDTLGFKAPAGWENPNRQGPDPLGGAYSAGSAVAALNEIKRQIPDGRAVLCSYGDIVPALLSFVAGAHGLNMPPKYDARGVVYTLVVDGDEASLSGRDASAGFPAS